MPTGSNSHVYELLPDYVLELLAGAEKRQVAYHLETCRDCQAELARLQVVVDDLPLALAQSSPPRRVKENLMNSIRQGTPVASNQKPFWSELAGILQKRLPALGLALILLLVLSNVLLFRQLNISGQKAGTPFQVISLAHTDYSPHAAGTLVLDAQGRYGTLVVDKLPFPGAGKQYQVWLTKNSQRISAGVFSVNYDGYASLELLAPLPLIQYDSIGITIEPAGGSSAPTGAKVLSGNLSRKTNILDNRTLQGHLAIRYQQSITRDL